MELAFEDAKRKSKRQILPRFNPSYRGIGFWRRRSAAKYRNHHLCFNPSYRGIGFWRIYTFRLVNSKTIVSILLIVELAFEDLIQVRAQASVCSFNPSYRGIGFWRRYNTFMVKLLHGCFNPSYRGIGFWRFIELTDPYFRRVFQSFLSWNWLLKNCKGRTTQLRPTVSILLIVELAFEANFKYRKFHLLICFNPSYRGIGFWRYL